MSTKILSALVGLALVLMVLILGISAIQAGMEASTHCWPIACAPHAVTDSNGFFVQWEAK